MADRQPAAPACKTCGGSGIVDDGEINAYEDGTPYMCGPVKCVKDCPSCKAAAPALVPLSQAQERHMAIGESVERAAKDLPDGYELQVIVERGAAWATVTCPDVHTISPTFDGDHTIAEQVDGCTDAAIRHARGINGLTVGGGGGR